MSKLNWGLIQDGGTFESLMHALVFAVDPGAILFGRPGKDSGQDAKSSDGSTVYQSKHGQSMTMDDARKLALKELEIIKKYRAGNHANSGHWQNVTRWVLVANFKIIPNDQKKWNQEVIPAFQNEGLIAEYWSIERLDQELSEHPHVIDVFFGGENRVLVGLKEAYDLLENEMVGAASLENKFIDRLPTLEAIKAFVNSDEKRILAIVGPGGIGKSRLAYEALIQLVDDGWRGLWGLPGSMSMSSNWFRLLNGNQKTVVVLDNPDSPELVRAVIEQLATTERKNWKVILNCRSENRQVYHRYKNHQRFQTPVELQPLSEPESHELVNSIVGAECEPDWLHRVFNFTRGVPGWLCLIAEMTKAGKLEDVPASADAIADIYLDSCFSKIPEPEQQSARQFLKWLALWGFFRLPAYGERSAELEFLENQGISQSAVRGILDRLVQSGLVSNWGLEKRAFAVEPLIVRQQILTRWLLTEESGALRISHPGTDLMTRLASGGIPAADSALRTLSQLVCVRIGEQDSVSFMKPLFDALQTAAGGENLLIQHQVIDLIEKLGIADPEGSLEVLKLVRESQTPDQAVEDSFWGSHTMTHAALVAKIPWLLFQLSERVESPAVARRYLVELGQYVSREEVQGLKFDSGKGAKQLAKRLLCESRNADMFTSAAAEMALQGLDDEQAWPFAGLLVECLLTPIRETVGLAAKYTVYFRREVVEPDWPDWTFAKSVRQNAFEILGRSEKKTFSSRLWRILAHAHHDCHRILFHHQISSETGKAYRELLKADLETVLNILQQQRETIGLDLATHAREFWEWYLEHGKEPISVELAKQCETIYSEINNWRLQDFFRFDSPKNLVGETKRVADALKGAPSHVDIRKFFEEAKGFLESAREGKNDLADDWRIAELADDCGEQFDPFAETKNPITEFAQSTLANPDEQNPLSSYFAVCLCKRFLRDAKGSQGENLDSLLNQILELAACPADLLFRLYSSAHPNTTGTLNQVELDLIQSYRKLLTLEQWSTLMGVFCPVNATQVREVVWHQLNTIEDLAKRSEAFHRFFRSVRFSMLRYDLNPDKEMTNWFVEAIIRLKLDGSFLGSSDLEWMRENAGYKMNAQKFLELIQSRIALEKMPKPSESFSILPHEFRVQQWCEVDFDVAEEVAAFNQLCSLSLEASFTSYFWLPKYLTKLDPTGRHIADFIDMTLSDGSAENTDTLQRLAYLASGFLDTSQEWALIAGPICEKAKSLRRDERFKVYFGLSKKETGVITSMGDEIAPYYFSRQTTTERMRDAESVDSALRGYWEWALTRADEELRREKAWAEEEDHA